MSSFVQGNQSMLEYAYNISKAYIKRYGRNARSRIRRQTKARWLFRGMRREIFDVLHNDVKSLQEPYSTWWKIVNAAVDAEFYLSLRQNKNNSTFWNPQPLNYDKRHTGLKFDEKNYLHVYTDGSCLDNGSPNASGGIGVWFNYRNRMNFSGVLYTPYGRPATNICAEIKAITKAAWIAKKKGINRLAVFTDSEFAIDCITNYVFTWLLNGWVTSTGAIAVNKSELRQLLFAIKGMDIKWVHVPGHASVVGNIEADRLATAGAKKQFAASRNAA